MKLYYDCGKWKCYGEMKTITCKLPEKLDAELTVVARQEGIAKCEVVRGAIEDSIRHKGGKKSPRAFGLVSDLAGSVDGPADLLTNPKYLEDFGA